MTDTSAIDKASRLYDEAAGAVLQWFQQAALEDELRRQREAARTVAEAASRTAARVKAETARAAYADIREALGPLADEIVRMAYEYIQLRDWALLQYMQGEIAGTELARIHGMMMDMLRYIATYKLKIPPTEATGGGA